MSRGARLAAHDAVSTSLALRSDRALSELVDAAVPIGSGIGSPGCPGFGAWRELAVHTMTTNWVLADRFQGFPLMYHWPVLSRETRYPLEDIRRVAATSGLSIG